MLNLLKNKSKGNRIVHLITTKNSNFIVVKPRRFCTGVAVPRWAQFSTKIVYHDFLTCFMFNALIFDFLSPQLKWTSHFPASIDHSPLCPTRTFSMTRDINLWSLTSVQLVLAVYLNFPVTLVTGFISTIPK